jgi:hypothetical protein
MSLLHGYQRASHRIWRPVFSQGKRKCPFLKIYKNIELIYSNPLVPRWLLMVIDILLFWIAVLLDPQCFDPVASGDLHLPHRDLDTPVVSWVAVEPSGMVLPSRARPGTPKPFSAMPS